MKYFAYGSNLLSSRLLARVPAQSLGMALLPEHALRWDYHSLDGSGKCNIARTGRPEDAVHGVVYEMDANDLSTLDAIEQGYDRIEVLLIHNGETVSAWTYIYTKPSEQHPPYDWYKNLVVEGAIEHRFPDRVLHALQDVQAILDPKTDRPAKRHAEHLVAESRERRGHG